jgi:hypothetical protein
MRFYDREHQFYCGVDLHASSMYLCIQDDRGTILLHKNLPTSREAFQVAVQPYRESLAVAVECMFSWYWIADLCAQLDIAFVLGHALYMKAIHGGKTKSDKIDSKKIASLLRAKMLPMAYPYPAATRSTRDLLRRRMYFMHHQSELLTHIQNTNTEVQSAGLLQTHRPPVQPGRPIRALPRSDGPQEYRGRHGAPGCLSRHSPADRAAGARASPSP